MYNVDASHLLLASKQPRQVVSVAVSGEHVAYSSSSGIVQVPCSINGTGGCDKMPLQQIEGAIYIAILSYCNLLIKLFERLFQIIFLMNREFWIFSLHGA